MRRGDGHSTGLDRGDRRQLLRTKSRMGLVLAIPGLVMTGVVGKAFVIQVVEADVHREASAKQQAGHTRKHARRGSVVDRRGAILAHSAAGRSVWADPSAIDDPGATARAVGGALGLDPVAIHELHQRLARRGRQFAWIERHVTPRQADAVAALDLAGVGLKTEHKRYWPHKELAGQVLGLTNLDGKGIAGVERQWDEELSAEAQVVRGLRDARRRLIIDRTSERPVVGGNSVVLTLDAQIQHWVETELELAVTKHDAKGGLAIALAPETGDILAMSSVPRFNPNAGGRDADHQRNRVATDALEYGSIIKPISLAAVIGSGVADLTTMVDVEDGRLRLGGFWIKDVKRNQRISVRQCLEMSSNVCMAKLSQIIGRKRVADNMRAFGIGQSTGSGLLGESAGRLDAEARWSDSRLATVFYGYGFQATALQMASAVAAIANGGRLMRPRLVDRVVAPDGRTIRQTPVEVRGQATTQAIARQVALAMTDVVHGEHGTAKLARVPGYRAAGKTGTAQKVDPVLARYVDRYVSTFVGFAPVEAPRVVVLVSLDEPKPNHYAGKVAGPAFSRIVSRVMAHMEVPPSPGEGPAAAGLVTPAPEDEARLAVAAARAAAAPPPVELSDGDSPAIPTVPDFRGMSLRTALVEAGRREVHLRVRGGGRAVRQTPVAGAPLRPGELIDVEFHSVL